ncbi:hypothetical protein RB628_01585 [Streptomyces sp. ADMS]|nr:hypothetical protein [Streptomyces sp. ADMS]MDW4904059.1 hypothetical protein [Streptomyces sp. ADMS]
MVSVAVWETAGSMSSLAVPSGIVATVVLDGDPMPLIPVSRCGT